MEVLFERSENALERNWTVDCVVMSFQRTILIFQYVLPGRLVLFCALNVCVLAAVQDGKLLTLDPRQIGFRRRVNLRTGFE